MDEHAGHQRAAQLAAAPDRGSLRSPAAAQLQESLGRPIMNDELAALAQVVESGEQVLAQGMANRQPVLVTDQRIIRSCDLGPVSIPFDRLTGVEVQREAHRLAIRLSHQAIDPLRRPSDATQWWRWHDRRAHGRETERMWRETVLTFSREHTAAADAIAACLEQLNITTRELAPRPSQRSEQSTGWKTLLAEDDDA